MLPVIAWAPFFPALATPARGWRTNPVTCLGSPGFRRTLVPATLVPAVAGLGYRLHRRGL